MQNVASKRSITIPSRGTSYLQDKCLIVLCPKDMLLGSFLSHTLILSITNTWKHSKFSLFWSHSKKLFLYLRLSSHNYLDKKPSFSQPKETLNWFLEQRNHQLPWDKSTCHLKMKYREQLNRKFFSYFIFSEIKLVTYDKVNQKE
jgi:hypothetical protein